MPTNILLDAIRTRRGLKWGIPTIFLAVPYFFMAAILVQIIEDGPPTWLNMLVLLGIWNGLKMLWIGPLSLILLARTYASRLEVRRRNRRTAEQMHPVGTEPRDLETVR